LRQRVVFESLQNAKAKAHNEPGPALRDQVLLLKPVGMSDKSNKGAEERTMFSLDALSHSKFPRATLATLFALFVLSSSAPSQQTSPSNGSDTGEYKLSVNVGLVVLPVTVTNRKGQFVPNLAATDFYVSEAGRPQQITLFSSEDVPVTVGLVVDNSGSMGAKRPEVVAASLAFVQSSNPGDQMFVVNFSHRVSLGLPQSVPFTSDLPQLRDALSRNRPAGNTALYDGIATALEHLKAGNRQRKALIVVTDGGDNASRTNFQDLLNMAESSNAVIYTIGIFDPSYSGENPQALKRLAKATGGRAYFPESVSQVSDVTQQIARDIRQQYTIGYIPSPRSSEGSYRAIRVTVKAAGLGKLYVRTRTGYLIPPETQSVVSLAR
jgi:Ca-activated chloride channel homolog